MDKEKKKAPAYPAAPAPKEALDTNFNPAISVPMDSVLGLDSTLQNQWLEQQLELSLSFLTTSGNFNKNWKPNRLTGFPQQIDEEYYALGHLQGVQTLLKGQDLSTPEAYHYWMAPELLPADFSIQDFQVFPDRDKVALVLAHRAGGFHPALWFPENDSLHIWKKTMLKDQWLVLPKEDQLVFADDQSPDLWQINLPEGRLVPIKTPFSSAGHISICSQLPDSSLLIKKQEKHQPIEFWKLNQNQWSLLLRGTKDPFDWLGLVGGEHYFLSDFREGKREIFSVKESKGLEAFTSRVSASDFLITAAIITERGIYTLESQFGKNWLRLWSMDGNLLEEYSLPEALQQVSLNYYPGNGALLIQQLDPACGIRYVVVNPAYPQKVEIVHESLVNRSLTIHSEWRKIKSYDGTPILICLVYTGKLADKKEAASLFLPMPNQPLDLTYVHKDLAMANRLLHRQGILVFVFTRGNRLLGKKWYQAGSGPRLQLAFDDLQASISYCNHQAIGKSDRRSVWATAEQALNGAALLVQRPELVQRLYLGPGGFDLRPGYASPTSPFNQAWWWYQDSIPRRLIRQYSPYLALLPTNKGPITMVQSLNPYIFDPAAVFLARLQREMPYPAKIWGPFQQQKLISSDAQRSNWENRLDAFIFGLN